MYWKFEIVGSPGLHQGGVIILGANMALHVKSLKRGTGSSLSKESSVFVTSHACVGDLEKLRRGSCFALFRRMKTLGKSI